MDVTEEPLWRSHVDMAEQMERGFSCPDCPRPLRRHEISTVVFWTVLVQTSGTWERVILCPRPVAASGIRLYSSIHIPTPCSFTVCEYVSHLASNCVGHSWKSIQMWTACLRYCTCACAAFLSCLQCEFVCTLLDKLEHFCLTLFSSWPLGAKKSTMSVDTVCKMEMRWECVMGGVMKIGRDYWEGEEDSGETKDMPGEERTWGKRQEWKGNERRQGKSRNDRGDEEN